MILCSSLQAGLNDIDRVEPPSGLESCFLSCRCRTFVLVGSFASTSVFECTFALHSDQRRQNRRSVSSIPSEVRICLTDPLFFKISRQAEWIIDGYEILYRNRWSFGLKLTFWFAWQYLMHNVLLTFLSLFSCHFNYEKTENVKMK